MPNFEGHNVRFLIEIDGDVMECSDSLIVALALNQNDCLSWFLSGYFKQFPAENKVPSPFDDIDW